MFAFLKVYIVYKVYSQIYIGYYLFLSWDFEAAAINIKLHSWEKQEKNMSKFQSPSDIC